MTIPVTSSTQIIKVNHLVIGAGVVGLAIAEQLARSSTQSTFLVERLRSFGMETSSRNSEVIHGGFYYPPDSLKTKLCIQGRRLLYDFCSKHGIKHAKIGKWIVSTSKAEDPILDTIHERAKSLGVPTHFLSSTDAFKLEPNVKASKVLVSPETGIIDSHGFMSCLENEFLSHGGQAFYNTEITSLKRDSSHGLIVSLKDSADTIIQADWIINAAGLYSNIVSEGLRPPKRDIFYCKGHYAGLRNAKSLVSRLIYPVPDPNVKSLGIHGTLDLSGKLKFGPDVEYIQSPSDYGMPLGLKEKEKLDTFYTAISRYLRNIKREDLYLDYTGIRPKLSGPNDPFQDFVIEKEENGFINLLGIESPGLTASLAIAEYVVDLIKGKETRRGGLRRVLDQEQPSLWERNKKTP